MYHEKIVFETGVKNILKYFFIWMLKSWPLILFLIDLFLFFIFMHLIFGYSYYDYTTVSLTFPETQIVEIYV